MFTLAAKLSTHKYFHKKRKASRTDSSSSKEGASDEFLDEDFAFLAIHMVQLCVHSRALALVNAANYVLYFKFHNGERNTELVVCISLINFYSLGQKETIFFPRAHCKD